MDLMIESFPRLLNATKLTIELTLLSLFFGIFVGVFFAILRTSKNKIFCYIAYYYSYIFRGTPLLVQIFIIYFGLGQVEWIRESFLWIILKKVCILFIPKPSAASKTPLLIVSKADLKISDEYAPVFKVNARIAHE